MRKDVTGCFEPTLVTGSCGVPAKGRAHTTGCHVEEARNAVAAVFSAPRYVLFGEPLVSKTPPIRGTRNVRPRTRRPFTTSVLSQ